MLMSNPKFPRSIITVVRIVLVLVIMSVPIELATASSTIFFPPDSNPFGKKYKQWSTELWQYVYSFPQSVNPLLDTTGENCVLGQHGRVWFLVGTLRGGTATRTCTIPEGTALFFPVIHAVNVDSPNVCGQGPERIPIDDLRAWSAAFINGATNLLVEVDGQSIPLGKRFRIRSKVFSVALPEDNVFDTNVQCVDFGGVPGGIYSPAVDDGFYVMLKPLDVGDHTLHFHAENPGWAFPLDVTYNLTVVPTVLK